MNVEIGVRFIIGLQRINWNGKKMKSCSDYVDNIKAIKIKLLSMYIAILSTGSGCFEARY